MPPPSLARSDHPAALFADLVRVAALASAAVSLLWLPGETALRFGLLFGLLLVPRFVGIPRSFDAAFCAALLLATWAGARDWYVRVFWVDEAVHVVTIGATAAASYLVLATLQLMPGLQDPPVRRHRSSLLILAGALGLAAAALWEVYEWLASQFAPQTLHVGYADTMIDIMFGAVGALGAGVALMTWAAACRDRDEEPGAEPAEPPAGGDGPAAPQAAEPRAAADGSSDSLSR